MHAILLVVADSLPVLQAPAAPLSKLDILSKCAPIVSAIIAVLGVGFVSYQLVLVRRSHQTNTFLRIIDMARERHFSEHSNWVKYDMEDQIPYESLWGNKTTREHVTAVIHFFETLGILIERKYVNADLVFDQMGSWIEGVWHKLEHIIVTHRAKKKSPEYAENFDALARRYNEWASRHDAKLEKRPRLSGMAASGYYSVPRTTTSRASSPTDEANITSSTPSARE